MRVLFIYPSINAPCGINHGLAILSGVLKANGHETDLIHLHEVPNHITEKELIQRITTYNPDLIGFSILSQQYQEAVRLAKFIRKVTNVPIIAGGIHPTLVPEEVIQETIFDYICIGEGEGALLELLDCLQKGEDTTNIQNIWTRQNGVVTRNKVRPFQKLDDLPSPDYQLFDLENVFKSTKGWLNIMTSRGCPFTCTYCLNHEILYRYVADGAARGLPDYLRRYPVERTLEDILRLKTQFPQIKTIIFDDDLFTLNSEYIFHFCKLYKEMGIDLPFVVNAHIEAFSAEIARSLKNAGCAIVKFGIESGNDNLRRNILNRRMSNEKIKSTFEIAQRFGIQTSAFVLIGLPQEGKKELLETIELLAQIKVGRVRWAFLYPFPGTRIHTICSQLGIIDQTKMAKMTNYFDDSCLRFTDEHTLLLQKIGKFYHWWINAHSNFSCSCIYQELVDDILALSKTEWENNKEKYTSIDKNTSASLMKQGVLHYSNRFSPVMAVRSDWINIENS